MPDVADMYALWEEGGEILKYLSDLKSDYDLYMRNTNSTSESDFSPRERRMKRKDIIGRIEELSTDRGPPDPENFAHAVLRAEDAVRSFSRVPNKYRLSFRNDHDELYDLLYQTTPSDIETPRDSLLDDYRPPVHSEEGDTRPGPLYSASVRILQEGIGIMDEWVERTEKYHEERVEEEESFIDVTLPTDPSREESAERMAQ